MLYDIARLRNNPCLLARTVAKNRRANVWCRSGDTVKSQNGAAVKRSAASMRQTKRSAAGRFLEMTNCKRASNRLSCQCDTFDSKIIRKDTIAGPCQRQKCRRARPSSHLHGEFHSRRRRCQPKPKRLPN